MYVFVFDRRSLGLLTLTTLVVAVALFAGGLMSGLYFDLPQPPATPTAAGSTQTSPEQTLSALALEQLKRNPSAAATISTTSTSTSDALGKTTTTSTSTTSISTAKPADASEEGSTAEPTTESATPPAPSTPTTSSSGGTPSSPAPSSKLDAMPQEPAPPRVAAIVPRASRQRFAVQVAAFAVEANARREAEALMAAGYEASIVPPSATTSATLYLVLLGSFDERAEAESLATRFETREQRNVWVRELTAPSERGL